MPRVRARDGANTSRTMAQIIVRDSGGVQRIIQRVRGRDATNTLRTLFTGMAASATTPADGTAATFTVTSAASTVTVSGGVAPYTYNWVAWQNDPTTYNPDGIVILSPTGSSTQFRRGLAVGETINGSFMCEVTDANGATVTTNLVAVSLTRT